MARAEERRTFNVHKACRSQQKLKLCLPGAAGSGKTYSALLIAYGIIGRGDPSKILVGDTENGSAELYDDLLGEPFGHFNIDPPYSPQAFIDAIDMAEEMGAEVLILDGITPMWDNEGGILQMHDDYSRKMGNSYTAWGKVTPEYNKFVRKVLKCNIHLICTLRTKSAFEVGENASGKMTIRKLGTKSIMRDGLDYEFTTVFNMTSADGANYAQCMKDRTSLHENGELYTITVETGEEFVKWLNSGKEFAPNESVPHEYAEDYEEDEDGTVKKANAEEMEDGFDEFNF